jgi:hypothetical protein
MVEAAMFGTVVLSRSMTSAAKIAAKIHQRGTTGTTRGAETGMTQQLSETRD